MCERKTILLTENKGYQSQFNKQQIAINLFLNKSLYEVSDSPAKRFCTGVPFTITQYR